MSDIYHAVDTDALSAATEETVMQLAAPAGLRPTLLGLSLAFTDVISTDGVATIRIYRHTSGGTTGATVTPNPGDSAAPASGCTVNINFTAEPTQGAVIFERTLPMQALGEWVFNDGDIRVPASGKINIAVTAANARTAKVSILYRD